MIDLVGRLRREMGGTADAASASGSLQAKLAQMLAHMSTTVAGRIDLAVSSRLRGILSIQRGTLTISNPNLTADVTVSSFDTSRYELHTLGATGPANLNDLHAQLTAMSVVNSTTLRATRKAGTDFAVPGYQLVEHD